MEIKSLHDAYRTGERSVTDTINAVYDRIEADRSNAWIETRPREDLLSVAQQRERDDPADLPLYGVPFAIKDNIDHHALPTTAGCPAYAYTPGDSATVVERLEAAGALLVGKTNMDQFATGLVGTRTPYGACRNPRNESYISGGSSAGSAVAVAAGHVPFALGTDTAGSGRVPAAFTGIVGLKPTRGVLSTDGVVPACKSLDCVAIFANTAVDALEIERIAAGHDAADAYSRPRSDKFTPTIDPVDDVTIGVPDPDSLEFFGDDEAKRIYENALGSLSTLKVTVRRIDFEPFVRTAELLYDGPWVAERYAAVGEFIESNPDDVHPVVGEIIGWGADYAAVEAFEAMYRLKHYTKQVATVLDGIDAVVTPTTGTTYTVEEVRSAPIEYNSNLGYYTNFVNLLDLSAVSVPVGEWSDGPTFGMTVFGDAFEDGTVASIAKRIRRACQ